MTNIDSQTAVRRTSVTTDITRRAFEIALAVAITAAQAGAWLAFFWLVPLDLRIR